MREKGVTNSGLILWAPTMKTFHRQAGHVAGKTLTVKELRDLLANYPESMPVFAQWDDVLAFVSPDNFIEKRADKGDSTEACDCLVIDVSEY
jgi:hypothetical protein